MKNKGQIASQVFVYALGAVILAIVLLVGYQSIQSIIENSNKAQMVQFKNTLEKDIFSISSKFDKKTVSLTVPSRVFEVCFVTNYKINYNDFIDGLKGVNSDINRLPILKTEISSNKDDSQQEYLGDNIFFISSKKEVVDSFDIGKITLDQEPFLKCFEAERGKIKLVLSGKGDHTDIS